MGNCNTIAKFSFLEKKSSRKTMNVMYLSLTRLFQKGAHLDILTIHFLMPLTEGKIHFMLYHFREIISYYLHHLPVAIKVQGPKCLCSCPPLRLT